MKKYVALTLFAALAVCAACTKEPTDVVEKTDSTPVSTETPTVNEAADTESTDIESTDADEIDYESGLSDERFDGYDYRILVRKGQLDDQAPAEDSDDLVVAATYKRNREIEARYGITIHAYESSDTNYDTDAVNTILAGDDAYDIVFTHSRAAFTYAVQGTALNINDIDTIHLDKPWWSRDIADSCNINGKMYVLSGDISTSPLSAAMCLYFNKRIFDELGFAYPYDSVRDGTWTFDEFSYLVRKAGKDMNGDGVIEGPEDRYGFAAEEWESAINILYAAGQKIYDKDDDGNLYLSLYSNKTVSVFDSFFNLMNNDSCLLMTGVRKNYYDVWENGRAMFKDSEIGKAPKYRNMDDDFGILPYPKFDEADEYHTASNGGMSMAIIPITVSDANRTGAITEALCAYGSRDVIPAFYEVSLKTKYTRDDDSAEMIDLIKDSLIFDMGYLSGGTFQSCGYDLARSETPNFASYYSARESKAKDALAKFNAAYGGTD